MGSRARRVARDLEKYEYSDEDDSDYSSDDSSLTSSQEMSGSYSSDRPILKRKATKRAYPRPSPSMHKLPNSTIRYLCLALISTIVIFILSLVRMSYNSSRRIEAGELGSRPPPPPALWESFPFLTRYYGGLRTLVPFSENEPEYPLPEDEMPRQNLSMNERSSSSLDILPNKPFAAYINQITESYLSEYAPVQECFLDRKDTVRIPQLRYYQGRPKGFPDNIMGSYELLGLPEDICFERYGRLGPYGLGYGTKYGGTGTGQQGDMEGSETVWQGHDKVKTSNQVDYRRTDWGDAQKRCFQANAARFKTTGGTKNTRPKSAVNEEPEVIKILETATKLLPRTAVVIRSWDDFVYSEEDILNLRAMISELSLGSGGEYDIHLLVQVKDEAKNPVWADARTYDAHLARCVPEEFRDIATLWSETQMLMLYQGIFDVYARGPTLPVHGAYRGLQMAMQYFAHNHPEYEFFWHWEMDIRYTGHYYDLFTKLDSWTTKQPRKGLWERNSRFYVPSVHQSWEDFRQMVRVQTEMGTESPDKMWSGIKGGKEQAKSKTDKPIWGPKRPKDPEDWFETSEDPEPPTGYDRDKYVWGVGEAADLITLNPIFDPEGTTWRLANDFTGYNTTEGSPPRRAAIVTSSRMSKRLLKTMHRETAFKKHHAFSEMWAPTVALHHGYKAVYAPHPMYVDREWPTSYLASVMNAGRNGATGGSRISVFGEREHNLLGMTWYYNAGFAPNMWKRWLGFKVNNEGGQEFELNADEGRDGKGVNGMKGGEGRMCLPPMLLHPVKDVKLPVEGVSEVEEVSDSDPAA